MRQIECQGVLENHSRAFTLECLVCEDRVWIGAAETVIPDLGDAQEREIFESPAEDERTTCKETDEPVAVFSKRRTGLFAPAERTSNRV